MTSGEAETAQRLVREEEVHQGHDAKPKPSSSDAMLQLVKKPEQEDSALEPFHASKHAQHHHHPVDIDEDTPVDAVKAPGCFNRLKEEVEAVVETIAEKMHLKKPPASEKSSD